MVQCPDYPLAEEGVRMAKLEKKPQEDHSNDWLSTYSDMVTLLLTFFVLLYATSSVDEQKWQYIYQAFTSRGQYLNTHVDNPNPDPTAEGEGTVTEKPDSEKGSGVLPQSFDQLYQFMTKYVDENNLQQSVSVENGAAHLSIRFDNNVFFEPNSAVLSESGKKLLDDLSPGINAVKQSIKTCTINGHTADALSTVNDWDLSGDRAASVVKYMDFTKVLDTNQFRLKGSGHAEPVADNTTEEGRAKNRRVEMVLLKADLDYTDPEVLKDILRYDYGIDLDNFDPDAGNSDANKVPNDYAQAIIDSLDEKYPDIAGSGTTVGPVIPGDYDSFTVTVEETSSNA